jgi:hypothetical protein
MSTKEDHDPAAGALQQLIEAAKDPAAVATAAVVAADNPSTLVTNILQAAAMKTAPEDVARAAVAGTGDPAGIVKAAVESSNADQRGDVLKTAVRAAKTTDEQKDVAAAAVDAASGDKKKEVAAAAVDQLSADQRKDLISKMWPEASADRRWVYITGFLVAGGVAVGLGAIAWAAQGGTNSIASSLVVLATGFASAMLGGLLGAYIAR